MITAAFFDLDGTISDPSPGFLTSARAGLATVGAPDPGEEVLRHWIGPPLLESYAGYLGDRDRAAQALAGYRAVYDAEGFAQNTLYAGIVETLDGLRRDGVALYLCTAKPWPVATKVIAHFGLGDRFDRLFGPELDGTRNDKAELLAHALTETGVLAANAVMIGDRLMDIRAGRLNDVTTIGALYGFGSRIELEDAGADHIAADTGEIARLIAELRSAAVQRN